jgi:chromosome segregation ATPase
MANGQDPIQELSDALDQVRQDIATTDQSVQDSQVKLHDLNDLQAALAGALTALQASAKAIQDAQATAQTEAVDAQKTYDSIFPKVDAALSQAGKDAVKKAVKGVEDEIAALKKSRDQAVRDAAGADQAAEAAKKKALSSKQAYEQAKSALDQLGADLKEQQSQAARLKGALKGAAAANKHAEAYFLAGDLKAVLASLADLAQPEEEQKRAGEVVAKWKPMIVDQAEAAQKAADARGAQKKMSDTQQAYQRKWQNRLAAIRAAVGVAAPAAPADGGAAAPPVPAEANP